METANKELFDQEFIHSLPPLGVFHIAWVVMLCRHNHTFRKRVENWFSHVESKDKTDLRARLRSLDDAQHVGALYELIIFDYLRRAGLKPRRNPSFDGLTPDYGIELPGGQSCVVEVRAVFEDAANAHGKKQIHELLDKLNNGDAPFILAISVNEYPTGQISGGKIARAIVRDLKQAAVQFPGESVRIDLNTYGLVGQIIALPDATLGQTAVGGYTPPIGDGLPSKGTMHAALDKKIRKYKRLNQPYIVALGSTDLFPFNERTLISIMYGRPTTAVDVFSGDVSPGQTIGGMVTPNTAGETFNTRLSAVLYFETERDQDDVKTTMKLFHHPLPQYQLDSAAFTDIAQLVPVKDGSTVRMEWLQPKSNSISVS
jgi:hypothetical protein